MWLTKMDCGDNPSFSEEITMRNVKDIISLMHLFFPPNNWLSLYRDQNL